MLYVELVGGEGRLRPFKLVAVECLDVKCPSRIRRARRPVVGWRRARTDPRSPGKLFTALADAVARHGEPVDEHCLRYAKWSRLLRCLVVNTMLHRVFKVEGPVEEACRLYLDTLSAEDGWAAAESGLLSAAMRLPEDPSLEDLLAALRRGWAVAKTWRLFKKAGGARMKGLRRRLLRAAEAGDWEEFRLLEAAAGV